MVCNHGLAIDMHESKIITCKVTAHRGGDSVTQEDQEIPFGYLFSTMMFAVMMGSITFQKLEQKGLSWCSKDRLLTLALTLAGGSFTAMVYDNSTSVSHGILHI